MLRKVAFRDVSWEYNGWHVPEIYKALWNIITDKGYYIDEFKYGHAYTPEGNAQGVIGIWYATKEIDKKYTLIMLQVNFKLVWRNMPIPGAQGENPPTAPFGSARVWFHGFIHLDYLNKWAKSPFLRPLHVLRTRWFYRNREDVIKKQFRLEVEDIIKDLQEFVNFLPKIT